MKKTLFLLCCILGTTTLWAQPNSPKTSASQAVSTAWEKDLPTSDLIKWRRYIHENPELSFKEEKTSQYV